MSFIPAGSLAFAPNKAGSPAAAIRFTQPDGTELTGPASNPFPSTNGDAICDGLLGLNGGLAYGASGLDNGSGSGGDGTNDDFRAWGTDFSRTGGDTGPFMQSIASNYANAFYAITRTTDTKVRKYSVVGAGGTSWTIASGVANNILCLGVAPDESIAYYGEEDGDTVKRYSLSGSTGLSDLVTNGGQKLTPNSILVMRDGTILVGWSGTTVIRYSTAGAVLNTYTLTGATGGPDGDRCTLTPAGSDVSFWVSFYLSDTSVRVQQIRVSDGGILSSFDKSLASFAWNGPFCYVGADIGTPVTGPPPDPKPAIPTVPCIPSVTVLSSPAVAAGCNQGGTGWTPFYLGASGTVPVGADPDDGEPLTGARTVHVWAEIAHTDTSGNNDPLRYAMTDLDDTARKEGIVLSFDDIEHSYSDAAGSLVGTTLGVTVSDIVSRPIGSRLADPTRKFFNRDEVVILALSDRGRRTGATPRRLGRGLVMDVQYGTPGTVKVSATDHFFIGGGSFGPDRNVPGWTIPTLFINAPPDVFSRPMPIIIGEVSDEGALDKVTNLPSSRGMCPLIYLGQDGLATGPGGTAEIWGRFLVCAFAVSKIISLYASNLGGGLYGRGNATSDGADSSVISLGGSPDLSSVPVPATPDDQGITITLYTLKGRQTSEISAVDVGGFTVTVKNKIDPADATNVDWIIDEAQPDRTRIDIAARNGRDVMCPGYPNYIRTTPYEDDMGSDGVQYRGTYIWLRGPLLDDVLAGIVTPAANVVGIEDRGDGTGLPVTDYFTAFNWFVENIVIRNSHIPTGPGQLWPQHDGDLSTYADGTYMVRGSSFVAAQARTVTAFGGAGLQVSAYFGEQLAMRDAVQLWNDNGWCRTGTNEHGQLCVLKLNLYDDPSTWPRIEHVSRIFGPVTMTMPQAEIENPVQGTCDWDADFGRFRNALVTRIDNDALAHNKGMRKPSAIIDGRLTRDPLQFQFILDERLTYAKDGPTYYTFQGDLGLADYPMGSGILFTSIMGPGANGVVDLPMIILKKHVALSEHLVTLTCLAPTFLTPPELDYQTTTTMATGIALALQGCMVRNLYWGGDNVNGFDSASVWDAFHQSDGVEIDNTGNQISGLSGVVIQVRVKLRVADASINVTPRIYNVTDSAVATTSGAAACSATATDFSGSNQEQTLALTLASGKKKYKLQLVPSGGGHQAWASGVVSDIYVP